MLMVGLMLAAAVVMAFPKAASANIMDASVNWYGQAYEGSDPFYASRNVLAFTENGTATVNFGYLNDTGSDIKAKPFIQFDWGTRYYGTEVSIAYLEAATLSIQFTVPTAAAAGLVEHGYYIGVEYQQDTGRNYNEESVIGEAWTAPIGDDTYTLSNPPIVADSLKVWKSTDGVAWSAVAATAYSLTAWTGEIDFIDVPTVVTYFLFNYSYYENLGTGDGVSKVFSVYHHPPGYGQVIGTPMVYVADATAKTITATTAFSFDAMSGEVTLTTAPSPNEMVLARYSFYDVIGDRYNSSDPPGRTFVVYSQAQADAMSAHLAVDELWDQVDEYLMAFEVDGGVENIYISNYDDYDMVIGSDTTKALAAGWAADDEAWDLYVAGDFAGATTKWDEAATQLQAALDTQSALIGSIEDGMTGLITSAGSWLDAQVTKADADAASATALVDAQKAKTQAEASRASRYGIFFILLGVGVLLVGVGGLLWGVSRVIGVRKANQ
jgi:hypothetical protein